MAVATACAALLLIIAGAGANAPRADVVPQAQPTSADHSDNSPDRRDTQQVRWQDGRRLAGCAAGILAVLLVGLSWRARGAVRTAGIATLIAIVVQWLAGGLQVVQISTAAALARQVAAHICFCLAAATALITSAGWNDSRGGSPDNASTFLKRLCFVGVAVVFIQLVLGAVLRRLGGNHSLIAHLVWVPVVVLLLAWISLWVVGHHCDCKVLAGLGQALAALMIGQVLLGGLTLLATVMNVSMSPFALWAIPAAHMAVGALLLGCCVLLAMSTTHLVRPAPVQEPPGVTSPIASS